MANNLRVRALIFAFAVGALWLWPADGSGIVAQTADVIDDPEAYAVYASMPPPLFSSNDKDLKHVALLQDTTSLSCFPKEGPPWDQAVEDYKTANARVWRLSPTLDLGVMITFVSGPEFAALNKASIDRIPPNDGTPPYGPDPFARFPNRKVLSLSAVGFDKTRTRAFFSLSYRCGFNCGGGWTIFREKVNGRWVEPKEILTSCTVTA